MNNKYIRKKSNDVLNILQNELLNRLQEEKILNNLEGLALLEEKANQVCKDVLLPYIN